MAIRNVAILRVSVGKPTLLAKNFGVWIRALRLRRRRSHEGVAGPIRVLLKPTGLGVHPSTIVRVEQGRVPSVPLLYGLSRALRVPFEEMAARLLEDLDIDVDVPIATEAEDDTSDRAVALAMWFDELPHEKQDAVMDILHVPEQTKRRPTRRRPAAQ